jgi:hypothetical protein
VWCPDWFQGTSLGSSPDCFPDCFPGSSLGSSLETASQTPSQTPSQEVSGKVSGKLSRQLPRQLPRHLFQEVSGKRSGQLQEQVSWDPRKPPENPKFGCFPGTWETELPDGRSKGLGSSRSSIPYSIYISQFQTGTPKPRYIGFRDGGRENGTQNGQFRPVFGHILRPLSDPSLFEQFRALERPRAWFPEKS